MKEFLSKRLRKTFYRGFSVEIWLDRRSKSSHVEDLELFDRILVAEDNIPCIQIIDENDQSRARSLIGSVDWLLLELPDWKMIPLENLVSSAQGTPTKIAALINKPMDVQGAAHALQIGVDAVLIENREEMLEAALIAKSQRLENQKLVSERSHEYCEEKLSKVRITSIESAGVGDRVCIDMTSLLNYGEGLVVGSSSTSMLLIHAENIDSQYVPPRPFRVNAGGIHAYTLLNDGKTVYLSELKAGDELRIFSSEGTTRSAVVGRLKIETRPLILLKWVDENNNQYQSFLQQAETVRLVSSDRKPVAITELKVGDIILSRFDSGARHIGEKVSADIEER